MIHPDWLKAFEAFAETRSFTAAGERLHLTQPAVHAQVRKLSESLGVSLYERRGRAMVLTSAGERVLAHARETLEREAALRSALGGRDDAPVVIAAGEGAFLYLLPDAMRTLAAEGDAPLRLMTASGPEVLEALRLGRAHVGVTVVTEKPDDLEGRVLARVGAKVIMPRGHPLARRKRVSPTHLDGAALIVPPRGRPHREAVLRALADAGSVPRIAVEAHGWELLMHYVGLGLGVAIVNGICRTPRGLDERPFVGLPRIAYWVLCRPRARERAAVASAWREIVAASQP